MAYIIRELKETFGSQSKALEIILLFADGKKVVRQGFYDSELKTVIDFCKKNNIFFVQSPFKILNTDNNKTYSNKGLRIPLTDSREGMIFVYISKDEILANLACLHETKNDHHALGILLGYPECCVNYFCKTFSEKQPDLTLKPTNPYTNLSKRDKDYVLLSHFPCNSDCEDSIALAKSYLKVLEENDREFAKVLIDNLK